MEETVKNELCIINSNFAYVSNLSEGYLRRVYLCSLFSNMLNHTQATIVWLWSPFIGSDNLTSLLDNFKDHLHLLNAEKNSKYTQLPAILSFSFIKSCDSKLNQKFIELLTSSWVAYDHNEVYFMESLTNISYQEDIIVRREKRSIDVNKLNSHIYIDQAHADEDINIYKRFKKIELPFDTLFTVDPALAIQKFIQEDGLYKISYSDQIVKNIRKIDSILTEYGLENIHQNPNININELSDENQLILDLKKERSVSIQIILENDMIYFNIDRMFKAISIENMFLDLLKETIKTLLFSKINIEYRGRFITRIYFLSNNNIISCIKNSYLPLINIFSKKKIFEYEPIITNNLS